MQRLWDAPLGASVLTIEAPLQAAIAAVILQQLTPQGDSGGATEHREAEEKMEDKHNLQEIRASSERTFTLVTWCQIL